MIGIEMSKSEIERETERQAHLNRLQNEMLLLPGNSIIRSLEILSETHYIVDSNYNDLINLVVKHETEFALTSLLSTDMQSHDNAILEILRMLHNYLSSVQSLIDHTRRVKKSLNNDELNISWKNEINRLLSNDCSIFVKQFRNYMQHFRTPSLSSILSFSNPVEVLNILDPDLSIETIRREFKPTFRFLLNAEDLLEWDGWYPASKRYIHTFGEHLDMRVIFLEYQTLNHNFKDRFYNKIYLLYESEIKEVDRIRNKIGEIMAEDTTL